MLAAVGRLVLAVDEWQNHVLAANGIFRTFAKCQSSFSLSISNKLTISKKIDNFESHLNLNLNSNLKPKLNLEIRSY